MSQTATVFTIMASAVVVLGGLVAVARVMIRLAWDIRENKAATVLNTQELAKLNEQMDGRLIRMEARIRRLERKDRKNGGAPGRPGGQGQ